MIFAISKKTALLNWIHSFGNSFKRKGEESKQNNNLYKNRKNKPRKNVINVIKSCVCAKIWTHAGNTRTPMSYPLCLLDFWHFSDFSGNLKIHGKTEIRLQNYCLGILFPNPKAETLPCNSTSRTWQNTPLYLSHIIKNMLCGTLIATCIWAAKPPKIIALEQNKAPFKPRLGGAENFTAVSLLIHRPALP